REALTSDVLKHLVWNYRLVEWVSRAEVHVEVSIVVDVTKIATHCKDILVKTNFIGNVCECTVAIVSVQQHLFHFVRKSEFFRRSVCSQGFLKCVVTREDVEPSIIIEVPEPRRECPAFFLVNAGLSGYIFKKNLTISDITQVPQEFAL